MSAVHLATRAGTLCTRSGRETTNRLGGITCRFCLGRFAREIDAGAERYLIWRYEQAARRIGLIEPWQFIADQVDTPSGRAVRAIFGSIMQWLDESGYRPGDNT